MLREHDDDDRTIDPAGEIARDEAMTGGPPCASVCEQCAGVGTSPNMCGRCATQSAAAAVPCGEAGPRAPLPQAGCEVGGIVRAHSAPARLRPPLGDDTPTAAEVAAAAATGASLSKRGMAALCASVVQRAAQSANGRGAGWGGGGAHSTTLRASAVLPPAPLSSHNLSA